MIKAVFFDMDGTITRPHIDWKSLRADVGVPEGMPIMAYIESLEGREQHQANTLLEAAEVEAAEQAQLNPGVQQVLAHLRANCLLLALITNNHRRAMRFVTEKFGLEFDLLLSREDAPLKPAPDLLLLALERLALQPTEACFVGDGFYDRQASQAAGIIYIHLDHQSDGRETTDPTIRHLQQLYEHIGLGPPRDV